MRLLATLIVGAVVSLVATWPLRKLALAAGVLDMPGPRKTHGQPIPYLGGIAVLLGMAVPIVALEPTAWRVVVLLGLMSTLGLIDDLGMANVRLKIFVEFVLGVGAVGLGFVWHLTGWLPADAAISLVWMVGLTNSFNMLDNMDGLSSTIAATSLLAFVFMTPRVGLVPLALAGALVGFLYVNRPPARMFLGDAGSLMVGFGVALGSISVANSLGGAQSIPLLGFPVAVALFDTSLVIVSRGRSHRPVQVGGRDHFSHRLRLLGWSPRQILFAAFVVSAIGGWVGYELMHRSSVATWMAIPIGGALVIAWFRLLGLNPYTSMQRGR